MKQHPEMSLFVKHVVDKQQFRVKIPPFFSDAKVDIAMPSPACSRVPTQSR